MIPDDLADERVVDCVDVGKQTASSSVIEILGIGDVGGLQIEDVTVARNEVLQIFSDLDARNVTVIIQELKRVGVRDRPENAGRNENCVGSPVSGERRAEQRVQVEQADRGEGAIDRQQGQGVVIVNDDHVEEQQDGCEGSHDETQQGPLRVNRIPDELP